MNRIKQIRQEQGLSLRALAEKMGPDVHFTTLSKLENGKRALTMDWAIRISLALEADIGDVMGFGETTLDPIPIRRLRSDRDWKAAEATGLMPGLKRTTSSFYVTADSIANIPALKMYNANPDVAAGLYFVETAFDTLVDSFFYLYRGIDGAYRIGVYRDAPPRFQSPPEGEPSSDMLFGKSSFEVIGTVSAFVRYLYSEPEPVAE